MESKILTFILLGVIGILSFTIVKDRYINPPKRTVVSDTVYVDKPFKVETIIRGDEIIPATVTLWEPDTTRSVGRIELIRDTVRVYVDSSTSYTYSTRFLSNYPEVPKFLNLKLEKNLLEFTGMSPSGTVQTNSYSLDLSRNTYQLLPNGRGGVGLKEDRVHSFLGLKFKFSHSLMVGSSWFLRDSEIKSYPLLRWNPEIEVYDNMLLSGTGGINQGTLLGEIGIKYRFK